MNTPNHVILTEIAAAAAYLEEQITGIEIRAHYSTTSPEAGDTIRSTTLTIRFGGTCIAYLTRRETPDNVSWITQDDNGYTEVRYALQDTLDNYYARINASL